MKAPIKMTLILAALALSTIGCKFGTSSGLSEGSPYDTFGETVKNANAALSELNEQEQDFRDAYESGFIDEETYSEYQKTIANDRYKYEGQLKAGEQLMQAEIAKNPLTLGLQPHGLIAGLDGNVYHNGNAVLTHEGAKNLLNLQSNGHVDINSDGTYNFNGNRYSLNGGTAIKTPSNQQFVGPNLPTFQGQSAANQSTSQFQPINQSGSFGNTSSLNDRVNSYLQKNGTLTSNPGDVINQAYYSANNVSQLHQKMAQGAVGPNGSRWDIQSGGYISGQDFNRFYPSAPQLTAPNSVFGNSQTTQNTQYQMQSFPSQSTQYNSTSGQQPFCVHYDVNNNCLRYQ